MDFRRKPGIEKTQLNILTIFFFGLEKRPILLFDVAKSFFQQGVKVRCGPVPSEALWEGQRKAMDKAVRKMLLPSRFIPQRWAPALTFTLYLIIALGESLKAFGVTILIKSESSTRARHAEALSVVVIGEKWNVK